MFDLLAPCIAKWQFLLNVEAVLSGLRNHENSHPSFTCLLSGLAVCAAMLRFQLRGNTKRHTLSGNQNLLRSRKALPAT